MGMFLCFVDINDSFTFYEFLTLVFFQHFRAKNNIDSQLISKRI